jgi:hypothetical protein
MKAVSYIALALSVVALALGVYAFTGGFGSAGTAVLGTTSTSTTTGTVTAPAAGTVAQTSDARTIAITISDSSKTVAVLDNAGVKLADVVLRAMTNSAAGNVTVFRGWYVSEIRVAAGVEQRYVTEVLPVVGTLTVTDQAAILSYTSKAINTYKVIVNTSDFAQKLLTAAQGVASSGLTSALGVNANSRVLITDSRTKITGITAANQTGFAQWVVAASEECDPTTNPTCKGTSQQEQT